MYSNMKGANWLFPADCVPGFRSVFEVNVCEESPCVVSGRHSVVYSNSYDRTRKEREKQEQMQNEKPVEKGLVVAIARGDSLVFPDGEPPEISEVRQDPPTEEKSILKKPVVAIQRGKKLTIIEEDSNHGQER